MGSRLDISGNLALFHCWETGQYGATGLHLESGEGKGNPCRWKWASPCELV